MHGIVNRDMGTRNRQAGKEIAIFELFANAVGLRPRSIEKREPPEPDILCVLGEDPVAFEMVELIEQRTIAHPTYEAIKLKRLLDQGYEELPANIRTDLKKRLGDALVNVEFDPGSSLVRKKNTIPHILSSLGSLNPCFVGEIQVPAQLRKVVDEVKVCRGNFVGPEFDVGAGGAFQDPTLERIREKFSKAYASTWAIELVGYYEFQPVLHECFWKSEVQRFVRQNIGSSPFRRIWVFDAKRREVLFVYPATKVD